jgi:hypothetical protein
MIDNGESIDTIVLGGSTKDDTITLTGLDSLSTSLSTDYSYSATLGTPTSISACGTGATGGGGGGSLPTIGVTGGSLMWGNVGTPYTYTTGAPGTISAGGNWTTYNNHPQVLKVEGDAEFKGEVTIRGVKLDDRLTAIEERLGILRPNNDLEGKWEKLKALGEEYRKLEQEILAGENIWDILKK